MMTETAVQAIQYWDLVPAVVGGVIGALAAGIPAWLLAKRESDETLRRDHQQRTANEKALAFAVCVKLLTIINSTISLRNHVQSCVAITALPGNEHMQPFHVLIPMIGHTDEGTTKFQPEEMAVFEAAKEREFMMDTMLLSQRHASALATFQEYCQRREAFFAIGPKPESFEGQMGSAMLTDDQIVQFMPYTLPLNNIVQQLTIGLEEDLRLAKKVALNFGPIVQKYFDDKSFAGLTFPSDEELLAMACPPPELVPSRYLRRSFPTRPTKPVFAKSLPT